MIELEWYTYRTLEAAMLRPKAERERIDRKRDTSRPYHRPRLRVYGALRDLTAGGSVDRPEASGVGNRFKRT